MVAALIEKEHILRQKGEGAVLLEICQQGILVVFLLEDRGIHVVFADHQLVGKILQRCQLRLKIIQNGRCLFAVVVLTERLALLVHHEQKQKAQGETGNQCERDERDQKWVVPIVKCAIPLFSHLYDFS